ncbi:hypothetical protein PIB30_021446 [Stylosanthes scabra]|uniref:Uncharacterized protein n=1 Tax=Stylosanthes scabra TaxID=79078 RepID=A0ABU6V719_9FABA|nr:hypothetical protein [Stylosanthes scabra]
MRQKRRKRTGKDAEVADRVLGYDSAWEQDVHPVDLAFPENFSYRKALDAGLTSASVRKPLLAMPPERLLRTSHQYLCKSLVCLQVGLESTVAAEVKAKKELLAAQDQIAVLKAERDFALAYLPLLEKLEEDIKVQDVKLQACRASLERKQKRAGVAEKNVEGLTSSLGERQIALDTANAMVDHWCNEWKKLGTETEEMCQETLEIVLDQVSHLCPGMDFSTITLDTRWNPKGRRIYNPKEAVGEDSQIIEDTPQPELEQQV